MNVEHKIDHMSKTKKLQNCQILIKIRFRTLRIFWDEKNSDDSKNFERQYLKN